MKTSVTRSCTSPGTMQGLRETHNSQQQSGRFVHSVMERSIEGEPGLDKVWFQLSRLLLPAAPQSPIQLHQALVLVAARLRE